MTSAAGKPTRTLILLMMVLVLITILFAFWFYRKRNLSVDPRVAPARELYEGYNALTLENDFAGVIRLLDTIDYIYRSFPPYYASFETGVLENNRAAVYLTLALTYEDVIPPFDHLSQDSLVSLGESAIRNSIYIYEKWMADYSGKSAEEIREQVGETFDIGLDKYPSGETDRFLDTRIEEILEAVKETPRRLSVSYTNLGIVYRYHDDYENASSCYRRAMELWEDNLTAENNLNILLGKPMKKRSLLRKIFPKPAD